MSAFIRAARRRLAHSKAWFLSPSFLFSLVPQRFLLMGRRISQSPSINGVFDSLALSLAFSDVH
jgi:hypothetical protein